MKEIFEKILKQFPEAKGIAIIGVDGNRTIDMECNCPQCQAERAEQQAKKQSEEIEASDDIFKFEIGDVVKIPVMDVPEMCVRNSYLSDDNNVYVICNWFDVDLCLQEETFNQAQLKLVKTVKE